MKSFLTNFYNKLPLKLQITLSTLQEALSVFGRKRLFYIAGYMAFTGFMALFPFLIFLVGLASIIGDAALAIEVIDRMFEYFPQNVVKTLAPVIKEVLSKEHGGLLTFGTVGTLWAASAGIEALRTALNIVYDIEESRPFVKRRLQSIGIVLGSAVLMLILSVFIIWWPLIIAGFEKWAHLSLSTIKFWDFLRFPAVFLVLTAAFNTIYQILPNTSRINRYRRGSFIAAGGWMILASLFSVYLAYFGKYAVTYGSLGGIIITLLFLQFSSLVILFGAAYNRSMDKLYTKEKG